MRKSRLSQDKQERLLEYFVSAATARTAAALVGIHKNTAALYFHRLRQRIPASAGMTLLISSPPRRRGSSDFNVDVSYALFLDSCLRRNDIRGAGKLHKGCRNDVGGVVPTPFPVVPAQAGTQCEWRFNNPDPKQQVLRLTELIKRQLN